MATFGFQRHHFTALLEADPFRPFSFGMIGLSTDWRVEDPARVRFNGDILIIRDGGHEFWVAPAAIAYIEVEASSSPPSD